MTDERLDFEREMYWGVVEEASLGKIALGVVDHTLDGQEHVHGPWEAKDCSAFLMEWFDRGLLDLYDSSEGHPANRPEVAGPPSTRHGPTGAIPSARVKRLLADWQHWSSGDDLWAVVRLFATDRGAHEIREPTASSGTS